MKLNNGSKIIGTDDIFVSSNNSQIGEDLAAVLTKQDSDILDLKKNVKWLYKYGGVGGSGGGSSIESTKISCTIAYTNTAGKEVQAKITEGSTFNIQKGSQITVSCSIVSKKSLSEYKMTFAGESITIKATDVAGVKKLIPTANTAYTLVVIGETTVSLDFSVFVDVQEVSGKILLSNGISITSNQSIYASQLEGANYVFQLVNYQPSSFESFVNSISLNGVELDSSKYTVTETIDTTGAKTTTVKVLITDVFTDYDIYYFKVNYTFGSDTNVLSSQFIYQSDQAFVYCYANAFNVYKNPTSEPEGTNSYNNTISYSIYPNKTDSITAQYNLTIEVEGNKTTQVVSSGTTYTYTITNTVKTLEPKEIAIKFSLDNTSYTYYIYLIKPENVVYIFEKDGVKLYQAVSCDTEEKNNDIIEFPAGNPLIEGNPIQITEEKTYQLKTICTHQGTLYESNPENTLVSDFLTSSPQTLGNQSRVDALFSFGFKYGGSNWDAKILTIKHAGSGSTTEVTLYKNKLTFSNGTETTKVCIPNDGEYHLVQLYFKSDYTTDTEYADSGDTSQSKQVVALFIDGVIETAPFEVPNFFIENNYTYLVYHVGQWTFDHVGVATFNSKLLKGFYGTDHSAIARYLFDFDPFIPANYYQTYQVKLRGKQINAFDRSIYTAFDQTSAGKPQWLNYFCYDQDDEQNNLYLHKFINVSPSIISKIAPDMEIYRIIPESTHFTKDESGFEEVPDEHFNQFVYNTFTSFGETDKISKVTCNFQKWVDDKFVDLISDKEGEDSIQFRIKYQGSSTLLYSCKNFEISAAPLIDDEGVSRNVYFTPDINKFPKLEQSFNLKADLVDSSHSNNVVIGNFVNDYMTSPFNTTDRTYRACLTGKPILLFIQNNARDKSGETVYDTSDFFLGIYSLNLNRSSVNNLGYSRLMKNDNDEIDPGTDEELQDRCCDRITKFHVLEGTEKIDSSNSFAVAEIQGNGILYDWSQFDQTLLANEVLGDFYVMENGRISEEFSTVFNRPFKALAQIIKTYLLGNTPVFNCIDYSKIFTENELISPETYYYTNDGAITNLPKDALVVSSTTLNNLSDPMPYRSYTTTTQGLKISQINNPMYQFHLVCNSLGQPLINNKVQYYYMEKLNQLNYDSENPPAYIDIESAVKYYVVCMAFAMVDSVQKNLTIKCPDTKVKNIWYPEFYDMDTAFGVSNSGGETSFQAYSDWVNNDGTITQDYTDKDAGEGYYDTPSSFLFMYAKYLDILNSEFSGGKGVYPYKEWATLRSSNGAFSSGTAFCKKYIDNFFGDINPIIWNLNYLYKYFSTSKNDSSTTGDSEIGRFNGTRRFSRKEYLNNRFRYLDVLFGCRNNANIGMDTNHTITNDTETMNSSNNSDIKVNAQMFPKFTKGVIGNIYATVTEEPRTPVVLQLSQNVSKLYLTDSQGIAIVSGNIPTNTGAGFYGTKELSSISECGQFLINSQNTNTIENNIIKDIVINKSPSSKTADLELDLKNLTSVENITISSGNYLYYKTITIKNSGSLTQQLAKLTLKNIQCNTLTINNISVNTLSISSCSCTELNLTTVTPSSFTYSDNFCQSVNFNNVKLNYDFTFKDLKCTAFTDSNSTFKNFTLNPNSYFSTLSLTGTTCSSFTIPSCYSLTSINVKQINCPKFYLNTSYGEGNSYGVAITDTLSLGFNNSTVDLRISAFSKITGLSLGNVTTCNLTTNALCGCSSLETLPNIKFVITGQGALGKTNKLSWEDKIKVKVGTSDLSGTFIQCKDITLDFVTQWLEAHKNDSTKATNFSRMFAFTAIEQVCKGSLTDEYLQFENAFIEYAGSNKINLQYTFYGTGFNILTKNFVNCSTSSLYCPAGGVGTSNSDKLYIEQLAFNKLTSVVISNSNLWNWWYRATCYVFERDGNDISVLDSSKMSDWFDDTCTLTSLSTFNPYNTKASPFDFEDGFPASITYIDMFRYTSCWVTNLQNAFKKSKSNCTLSQGSFNQSSGTNYKYDELPNLYEMLINDSGNFRVNISMNENIEGGSYAFWSTCTADEFKTLITKFKSSQTSDTKSLNYILQKTIVTDANSNILDYQLANFTNLIYSFKDCIFEDSNGEVVYIDLSNAFKTSSTDSKYKTVKRLDYCFANNYLERLTKRLTIQNVENLTCTFYNVNWQLTDFGKTVSTWDLRLSTDNYFDSIIVSSEDEFTILPENFFKICATNCNAYSCFAASTFSQGSLYGYLPSTDTLGLTDAISKGVQVGNIFENCRIIYHYTSDTTQNVYFFPQWYNRLSFSNKYKFYIPTPPIDGTVIYLFEDGTVYGSYDQLPQLPPKHGSSYTLSYFNNTKRSSYHLKPYPDCSGLPEISGTTYKNAIPYTLALLLDLNASISTVIENFDNASTQIQSKSTPVCINGGEPRWIGWVFQGSGTEESQKVSSKVSSYIFG